MADKNEQHVAVITGASSGIGKAAAKLLAAEGWRIIGQGRDAARCASAEAEIREAGGTGAQVEIVRADLSLVSGAVSLAKDIAARASRIDALLCNAGGVRAERVITEEGNEATFAGNHLGHFALVRDTLPLLRTAAATGGARVIVTSSLGHLASPPFDWNDPQMLEHWDGNQAYCRVKLYNILFTRELARRLARDGIIVHAMHPGRVASNFASHGDAQLQAYMASAELDPPERSAATLAFLASAPAPGQSSGGYWHECAELAPSAMALDDEAAARLWEESERLVAKAGF